MQKKSMCIRFGSRFDRQCSELTTGRGDSINWVDSCRYLGVHFVSGRVFRCDFHDAKCRFFVHLMLYLAKLAALRRSKLLLDCFELSVYLLCSTRVRRALCFLVKFIRLILV